MDKSTCDDAKNSKAVKIVGGVGKYILRIHLAGAFCTPNL